MDTVNNTVGAFLEAACVPLDAWHASGTLDAANALLSSQPEIASASIYTAAVLGDDATVRRLLEQDPASATAKGGSRGWDALTHLCFSRYLRLDPSRSDGFVRAAEALLDAGADSNTGWYSQEHQQDPEFESVLYGAAGVAHHPGLTRLLLDRGADPNDGETEYHAPEGFDDRAMHLIVESGRLAPRGLLTMLLRKLDWHHYDGVAWLLDHGADPNFLTHWGNRALHHALARDNSLRFFERLLDHGADPTLPDGAGASAFALAARGGRGDVLALFEHRGFSMALDPDDAFLAACARGDAALARTLVASDPTLVSRLQSRQAEILVDFAGAGNTAGVEILLDLGFDISSRRSTPRWRQGETALHVAVWREREPTVRLLLDRRAPLEAATGSGDTPLSLAVRALMERSEWTPHRSPALLSTLLQAGANVGTVKQFPTGSAEADALLRQYERIS